MATFTDNDGREHVIDVTVHTLRALKNSELHFDLMKILVPGSEEVQRTIEDPILLVDVVYFITQLDKPESERIDGPSFYKAIAGDALLNLQNALLEALADFCPSPEERALVRDLKQKAEGVRQATVTEARTTLEKIDLAKISTLRATTSASQTSPSGSFDFATISEAASSVSDPTNSAP